MKPAVGAAVCGFLGAVATAVVAYAMLGRQAGNRPEMVCLLVLLGAGPCAVAGAVVGATEAIVEAVREAGRGRKGD